MKTISASDIAEMPVEQRTWLKISGIQSLKCQKQWNCLLGISRNLKNASSRGTACRAPTTTVERFGKPIGGSLPTIVRSFKSAVTNRINEVRNEPGMKLWQRNYYDHIIRNEDELSAIREYIINNPLKWEFDRENPNIIVGARHAEPLQPGPDWEAGT